jgi:aminoglycoside phosphotransferase (APT) family kinase protein
MFEPVQLDRLAAHLRHVLAARTLAITHINRFHGGASRETFGLDVEADGRKVGLILRRDPPETLINTARNLEFAAFQSMVGSGLPIPRPISLCEDAAVVGSPFLIIERIDGGLPASPFDPAAYGDHNAKIGAQFFDHLGAIAARPALESPLAAVVDLPARDSCWRRELTYWAGLLMKDRLEPEPVAEAAIRWLWRNPPPPAQRLSIVHGDYRNGNVLHDGAGNLIAILDWEMAHIGDPYEDLGWALDPLWTMGKPDLASGLIPRDEAIARWQASSGCAFDPQAFEWWEVFAMIKGLSIWLSSARVFGQGVNSDPILAFSGWYTKISANRTLAVKMAALEGAT